MEYEVTLRKQRQRDIRCRAQKVDAGSLTAGKPSTNALCLENGRRARLWCGSQKHYYPYDPYALMTLSGEAPTVACSAPGKVLLAGGYLVLDREYTGLVFGLNARIYVHIQTLPTSPDLAKSEIVVRSPQFRDAEWRYGYRNTEEDGGIEITQLKGHTTAQQSQNRFIQTALAYTLTYTSTIHSATIKPALVTILADTDYYSYSGPSREDIPLPSGRFLDFNVPLNQAHKTGLGSSAALVTAFTAAMIAHYVPSRLHDTSSESGRLSVHNLAQAIHCAAQGKVGSGFDVAAAVYGSCVYKRFSSEILDGLGEVGMMGFSSRLKSVIEDGISMKKWDMKIDKAAARIPKGLLLVMCDVDCGSETVGMVGNVLAWRKKRPEEAVLLWATLETANEDLARQLRDLDKQPLTSSLDFDGLRSTILTIRSLIREMSEKAGVPIEPPVQTALIDACCELPGIIGGLVPGAGGYDAIALLVEDQEEVVDCLREFLNSYRANSENNGIGNIRLLGVRQEYQGLKTEDPSSYQPWLR
ncbi:MAG: hypothetical protein Q9217_004893 [Psora testacea]